MEDETKKVKRGGVLREILTAVTPHELLRMLTVYLAGVAAMFLLLVAVSLIPNAWIEDNVAQGRALAQEEYIGRWTPIFSYAPADELDLWTDDLIMETLIQNPEQTVFQRAVEGDVPGKPETRYWQGYKIFLRPAFILFTYTDMRAIMLYIFAAMLLLCILRLHKRFGSTAAVGLTIGMVLGHALIVPWCFQYFEIFWISLTAMAFLLRRYECRRVPVGKLTLWFLLIGMATQYFDFLTAPPLTLCLPLVVVLLADLHNDQMGMAQRWARLLWPCFGWAFGWACGWAVKWPVSSWLLHRDIVGDALNEAVYRSAWGRVSEAPADPLHALARNLFCMLPLNELRTHGNTALFLVVQMVFLCVLAAMLFRVFHCRPQRRKWLAVLPTVFCASLPYLWFAALAGHTEMHYIFTFRSQIASVFLLWNAWLYLADKLPPENAAAPTDTEK